MHPPKMAVELPRSRGLESGVYIQSHLIVHSGAGLFGVTVVAVGESLSNYSFVHHQHVSPKAVTPRAARRTWILQNARGTAHINTPHKVAIS